MTNTALQGMINEFGERICMLILDNDIRIYIGYPSSPLKSVNDIQFRTINNIDFIGVPKKSSKPADIKNGVSATIWHDTSIVQGVGVMDAGCGDYRIDPMDLG